MRGKPRGVWVCLSRRYTMRLATFKAGPMNSLPLPATADRSLLSPELPARPDPLRAAITAAWVRDEAEHVRELLLQARQPEADRLAVQATAADLVQRVRARAQDQGAIEAFM